MADKCYRRFGNERMALQKGLHQGLLPRRGGIRVPTASTALLGGGWPWGLTPAHMKGNKAMFDVSQL